MKRALDIRPGDTVIVPASYGGVDVWGWDPEATAPRDIAEAANPEIPRLRLHPDVVPSLVSRDDRGEPRHGPALNEIATLLAAAVSGGDEEEADDLQAQALGLLTEDGVTAPGIAGHVDELARSARPRRVVYPDGLGVVISLDWSPLTDEDDATSHTGPIALAEHRTRVREKVRWMAERCGLAPDVTHDLEIAAEHHDEGKDERRFQALLHGGERVAAERAAEVLAKGLRLRSRQAYRGAWRQSGLPRHFRHEARSLAKVWRSIGDLGAHDSELVLHLIASHHGCARPFFPMPDPPTMSDPARPHEGGAREDDWVLGLDGGVPDRYWLMTNRYGWFGLAYLEAILRLADHRASELTEAGGR